MASTTSENDDGGGGGFVLAPPAITTTTTTTTSPSASTIVNEPRKQHTSRYVVQTPSTIVQHETELECSPFFVDMKTLPQSQLDHLRETGLLPPPPPPPSKLKQQEQEQEQHDDGGDDESVGVGDHSSSSRIIIEEVLSDDEDNNNDINNDDNDNDANANSLDVCLLRNLHAKYLEQVWKIVDNDTTDENCCDDDNNSNSEPPSSSSSSSKFNYYRKLKSHFVSLDASKTWMLYWCLHGCDLLSVPIVEGDNNNNNNNDDPSSTTTTTTMPFLSIEECTRIVKFVESCWTNQIVYIIVPYDDENNDKDNINSLIKSTIITNDDDDNDTSTQQRQQRQQQQQQQQHVRMLKCNGGGFGGGPSYQLPHAATTYAAILSLAIVGSQIQQIQQQQQQPQDAEETNANPAYELLERTRPQLAVWIRSLQQQQQENNNNNSNDNIYNGSFKMHHDGEIDVRATYCIMTVLRLLNLPIPSIINQQTATKFVKNCQSKYEGGFGAVPYSESHGGYTFCGIGALYLLHYFDVISSSSSSNDNGSDSSPDGIDFDCLLGWLCRRQMSYEGGFNGRSNKLVDGCYSFWQGSALVIVSYLLTIMNLQHKRPEQQQQQQQCNNNIHHDPWILQQQQQRHSLLFDQGMLQRYILLCAQTVQGGLRDKPSKARDFYHTCYNLSGLSVSQQQQQPQQQQTHTAADASESNDDNISASTTGGTNKSEDNSSTNDNNINSNDTHFFFGHPAFSEVAMTHPVYNICIERVRHILKHFSK